uniref:Uncharacterized protein n=1 Tax=Scophthalmus maximus TaxID=52904 RepID=A0A8D3BU86_SCOMX
CLWSMTQDTCNWQGAPLVRGAFIVPLDSPSFSAERLVITSLHCHQRLNKTDDFTASQRQHGGLGKIIWLRTVMIDTSRISTMTIQVVCSYHWI